jgi:hypothetical protein
LKGAPTSPELTAEQVSVIGEGLTTTLQEEVAEFIVALPFESTTSAVKSDGPAAVGVPVIAPVMALRNSPAGRPLAGVIENIVYGGNPPVATREEL